MLPTGPLNKKSLETWLRANDPAALKGLERGEKPSEATTAKLAKAFGTNAPAIARVVEGYQKQTITKATEAAGGFSRFGGIEARQAEHGAGRDGASMQQFAFAKVDTAVSRRLDLLSGDHKVKDQFPPPADLQASRAALRKDLKEVPVLGAGGRVMDVHQKIMSDPVLSLEQKERIMNVLAEVRDSCVRLDDKVPAGDPTKGYQIVNWKHTRGEIDQVLEGARLLGLDAKQTEDALLASIFSDSVKWPANFITHNIDGAYAAAEVLGRHLDLSKPEEMARLEGIVKATKEHQIGPPAFMALMAGMFIGGAIKKETGAAPSDEQAATIKSLKEKIARPMDPAHLSADKTQIAFSPAELALLGKIGVKEWTVPHEGSAHYGASMAVIVGDSLINYASPDGWAKIGAIRGPGTIFLDATVFDSMKSAKQSYDDAMSILPADAKPLAEAGLARTMKAFDKVQTQLLREFGARKDIPRNEDGTIAFLNGPLNYGSPEKPLDDKGKQQLELAKEIRTRAVELMRAEQGSYA